MTKRKDHVEYRSWYSPIIDDYDFQQLSGDAFKVLFILKHSLGAAGLGIFKRLDTAERAGVSPEKLDELMKALEEPKGEAQVGWIIRERNLVWIVNGLANEPNLSSDNEKHRTYIRSLLAPLGEKSIVRKFRAQYPNWFGEAESGPKPPTTIDRDGDRVSGSVSATVSDGNAIHGSPKRSDASLKTEDLKRSDTIQKFLDRFYGEPGPRRDEVARQLSEAISPNGTKLKRGVRVSARNLAHLEKCARAVMAKPPDTPNAAIVLVLLKLQDPELNGRGETVTEAASSRSKQEVTIDTRQRRRLETAADEWKSANPDELAKLEKEAADKYPGDSPFVAITRNAWLLTEISNRIDKAKKRVA